MGHLLAGARVPQGTTKTLQELRAMARHHGQQARLCSRKLAVLLRFYRAKPQRNAWMYTEAMGLSRQLVFHLRYASTLSRIIAALKDRN
ncbi:hypothetical protein [Acidovorax sp.]|uniref:hypothetical protein n=1 Tax=Acidovorax sp. TaxID=1872122 RepID=UPI00262C0906|nr:hypothetical protein [Acidovorax sp.]